MKEFINKHQKDILGVLSGFDRVRFRGTFRFLAVAQLLMSWLSHQRVLIKDFGEFAGSLSQRLKRSVEEVARGCAVQRGVVLRHGESGVRYWRSPKISKEDLVQELIRREGLTEGVCVKHRLNRNTLKMYDKQGSVLRVETTINDTSDFGVHRAA